MVATDNILCGGPEPPLMDPKCQSLGAVVLEKFKEFGDADVFVR